MSEGIAVFLFKLVPIVEVCSVWIIRKHGAVIRERGRSDIEAFKREPELFQIILDPERIESVFLHMEQEVAIHAGDVIIFEFRKLQQRFARKNLRAVASETQHAFMARRVVAFSYGLVSLNDGFASDLAGKTNA